METTNNGGPAFPVSTSNEKYGHQDGPNTWQFQGMTLRDYFAAKAMQGMLADSQTRESCPEDQEEKWMRSFARACYYFADAMIAAREKQP